MGMRDFFAIDERIERLALQAEEQCAPVFAKIDETARHNAAKVLKAFADNRVSEPCFGASTGYGYGDMGRDVLDAVWAQVLGAEDALVRCGAAIHPGDGAVCQGLHLPGVREGRFRVP